MRDEDDLRKQEREEQQLDALRTHLVTMVVYGAGLAVVLFVLIFGFTLFQYRRQRREAAAFGG